MNKQLLTEMWERGDSVKEIAEACGITSQAVRKYRFELKLTPRQIRKSVTQEEIDYICANVHRSGIDIAKELGRPVSTIYWVIANKC